MLSAPTAHHGPSVGAPLRHLGAANGSCQGASVICYRSIVQSKSQGRCLFKTNLPNYNVLVRGINPMPRAGSASGRSVRIVKAISNTPTNDCNSGLSPHCRPAPDGNAAPAPKQYASMYSIIGQIGSCIFVCTVLIAWGLRIRLIRLLVAGMGHGWSHFY